MKVIQEFGPGVSVTDAAEALVLMARVTHDRQEGVFNGTPLVARWSSTVNEVVTNWHETRQQIQAGA